MAHTITGIDLGAASVKFAVIEAGFRHTRLLETFEEPVPSGEGTLIERQGEALANGLARLPPESTTFLAVPGEMLAVRVLDLPFADPRKIDQVVGYELEGQIVHSLQDVVYDYLILKPSAEGAAVLAAAARIDDVSDLLATLAARRVEPRALYAAPIVYRALFTAGNKRDVAVERSCQLVVDVGHRRTNLCFVSDGDCVYARTLTRGGEALTGAIAQAFGIPFEAAELAKRQHGFVASGGNPASTATAQRIDAAMRGPMTSLLRDLRQTLASFRGRDKTPLTGILLAGGSADLPGLAELLSEELELPVVRWRPEPVGDAADAADPTPEEITVVEGGGQGRFAQALAIAWAGARGSKELDLRRGPFVYRASFSVLRQKAMHLGALAAAVVIAATIDGTMSLSRLTQQQETLQAQLKSATQELFGEPRDARSVTTLLRRGFKDEMAPLPKATAFDLLDQISRKVPSQERIKLDIQELDIKPKKTTIRGTADSATAIDEMVGRLKEIECYEDIQKGSIKEATGGTKDFTLTIASKCP